MPTVLLTTVFKIENLLKSFQFVRGVFLDQIEYERDATAQDRVVPLNVPKTYMMLYYLIATKQN